MNLYLTLIYEFLQIGLFAAGGGLATLPFLNALADKYPWLTADMINQMVALSESTPGPLGINMATYAGYMAGYSTFGSPLMGVTTAFTATVSLVTPSFIVIMIVAKVIDRYKNSKAVNNAFSGLRPAVAGLIAAAAWTVIKPLLFDFKAADVSGFLKLPEIILFAALMIITNLKKFKKLHPLVFIALAAAAGIIIGCTLGW
ncbi:MAG: chromate transporter [Clostridia bacterium]|nr:chromate transporter [Clostridia bacterium]